MRLGIPQECVQHTKRLSIPISVNSNSFIETWTVRCCNLIRTYMNSPSNWIVIGFRLFAIAKNLRCILDVSFIFDINPNQKYTWKSIVSFHLIIHKIENIAKMTNKQTSWWQWKCKSKWIQTRKHSFKLFMYFCPHMYRTARLSR